MFNRTILFVFPLLLCSSCKQDVKKTTEAFPSGSLIEPSELKNILDSPHLKIIDLRSEDEFTCEHITSAQLVTRSDMENDESDLEGMMATKKQAEALMSKLGISPDDFIVLYDNKGNPDACRLYWILEVYGHRKKAILNGGFVAWKTTKNPVTSKTDPTKKSDYHFATNPKPKQHAGIGEMKKAIGNEAYVIIDSRTAAEYSGTMRKGTVSRSGHIPGSIHIDHELNIDQKNAYRFKQIAELKKIYARIPKDKTILVYCHSGVRSALTTFVLTELLGYPSVKNYAGSWIEWSAHPELPIESGEQINS